MPTSFTKLDIIQKACGLCGENVPQVEDDGSPEWDVASARYDLMLPVHAMRHTWNFATEMVALAAAPAPASPRFSYAYLRPPGSVRVVSLWTGGCQIDSYEAFGGALCCNVEPAAGVSAKSLRVTGPDEASAMFALGLVEDVQSALIRGLQEDYQRADAMEAKALGTMLEAKKLCDQESPPRDVHRGRIAERRRGRRPLP